MPPGIEIVIRTARIMRVQRIGLMRLGAINLVVIARIRPVIGQLPVPDNEHAVDVAVLPTRDVGVETGQPFAGGPPWPYRECSPRVPRKTMKAQRKLASQWSDQCNSTSLPASS